MKEKNNTDEYAPTTMKEVVYLTSGELDEMVRGKLAAATLADKKWIYNYFQGHDAWPIITDELGPKKKRTLPGAGQL